MLARTIIWTILFTFTQPTKLIQQPEFGISVKLRTEEGGRKSASRGFGPSSRRTKTAKTHRNGPLAQLISTATGCRFCRGTRLTVGLRKQTSEPCRDQVCSWTLAVRNTKYIAGMTPQSNGYLGTKAHLHENLADSANHLALLRDSMSAGKLSCENSAEPNTGKATALCKRRV